MGKTFFISDLHFGHANVGCMIPYMDYTPRTLEAILCSDIIRSNSKTEAAS